MHTEVIETRPHPLLRTHVLRYGGFSEYAPVAIRRREVAFSGVAVILALEGTWVLTDPARDGAWCTRQSFVGGLVGAPVLVKHTGFTLTLQFDLTPLGSPVQGGDRHDAEGLRASAALRARNATAGGRR